MPVEITVKLLLAAMKKNETTKFLIDGFPRSLNNYEVCSRATPAFPGLARRVEAPRPGVPEPVMHFLALHDGHGRLRSTSLELAQTNRDLCLTITRMVAGLGERGGRPSGRGLLPQFRLPGGGAGEKVRPSHAHRVTTRRPGS